MNYIRMNAAPCTVKALEQITYSKKYTKVLCEMHCVDFVTELFSIV